MCKRLFAIKMEIDVQVGMMNIHDPPAHMLVVNLVSLVYIAYIKCSSNLTLSLW